MVVRTVHSADPFSGVTRSEDRLAMMGPLLRSYFDYWSEYDPRLDAAYPPGHRLSLQFRPSAWQLFHSYNDRSYLDDYEPIMSAILRN